ncbi:MAG: ABC transporter ATP-binding protein [Bdellovibrionales bacterium]|nr:ABC transporter ATP-binding protein [Bdellovibrionales bacterium]
MILEIQNLTKKYIQGTSTIEALSDINFSMETGETLAIVGPSGSGKTTLLSLLAGLESATGGVVKIQGQNLFDLNERELSLFRSHHIGIVFQQFHLMPHLTALENVCLPLDIQGDENAAKKGLNALESVGLAHRQSHLPSELSGGECQRVAIARAIAVEPKVLLADEPSGNLDADTGNRVMDLVFDLVSKNRMTLILVTHNTELAKRCQRQVSLRGGKIQ